MNFDVSFFPLTSNISIICLFAALLICVIYALIKKPNKKITITFICIGLLFLVTGLAFRTQVKHQVKDYIENKNATLVICLYDGLFDTKYVEVDYRDYWKNMNCYTYKYNSKENIIYMQMSKFK